MSDNYEEPKILNLADALKQSIAKAQEKSADPTFPTCSECRRHVEEYRQAVLEAAELRKQLDRMREAVVAIKDLRAKRGERSTMTVDGDLVELFVGTMRDWFEESGGKNYVESRCVAGGREYVFTMQAADGQTPAEMAAELREQIKAADELAEAAEDSIGMLRGDCDHHDLRDALAAYRAARGTNG